MSSPVRVGTCSWADESLVKYWYPPSVRSAEARLRHYAERFDTVEFHAALEPLRSAGKLGGILVQFPSYIVCRPRSFEYLEWLQDQLRGDDLLVEFRHRSWLDEENRDRVLSFLEERRMTYVIVDAP